MALENFDYFIWEDEEPAVNQKAEGDTDVNTVDRPSENEETSDDTKTGGNSTTITTTTGGDSTSSTTGTPSN